MAHVTRIRGFVRQETCARRISLCNQSVEGQSGAQFAIAIMFQAEERIADREGRVRAVASQGGNRLGRRMQAEWEEHCGLIRGGISICRTNRYRQ